MQEVKLTELGKSYWNANGAYQAEYDKLYNELVPASGSAETLKGELIRAISRLVYEHCNNGNCNAREVDNPYSWDEDEYFDEFDGEGYVSDFYDKFLLLIHNYVPSAEALVELVRETICDNPNDFSDEVMGIYAHLCDHVIHYCLDPANPDPKLEEIVYQIG